MIVFARRVKLVNVPSWDLFIGLFFTIGVTYGFILQREKVVATLIAVYSSLVVSQTLSPLLLGFFAGDKPLFNSVFIQSHASPFTVRTIIFGLVIVLLTVKGGIIASRGRGMVSTLDVGVYSVLNTALIIAIILSFLPPELQNGFVEQSKFARYLIKYHDWWLVLPVLYMIFEGFRRGQTVSPISDLDY